MKCSCDITDKTRLTFNIILQTIIQIVLIGFYGGMNKTYADFPSSTIKDDILNWSGLSVAGGILILLTGLITIIINYKYFKWIIYLIIGINSLALLLLLIGMGIGSKYFDISNQSNTCVAIWFIEVALFILSLINLHSINNNNQQINEQSSKPTQQKQENINQTQMNQSQLPIVSQEQQILQQQQQQVV